MASGLENIETIESPFRRFVTTIGVFPTAFTDAMTYYECLAYLVKYLEDTVVPAVNENAEALAELQDYVAHYFDNLDVQEEINKKLDKMAQDGTLQEIITAYIQANVAWTFDSVADMKSATNLVAGSYARTLGYHSKDDGGAGLYYITGSGTADEMSIIAVGDLYANLVIGDTLTPEQFGAYGDTIHDDTAIIQECINYVSAKPITLKLVHNYLVSPIAKASNDNNRNICFELKTAVAIEGNGDNTGFVVDDTNHNIYWSVFYTPSGSYQNNLVFKNFKIYQNDNNLEDIEVTLKNPRYIFDFRSVITGLTMNEILFDHVYSRNIIMINNNDSSSSDIVIAKCKFNFHSVLDRVECSDCSALFLRCRNYIFNDNILDGDNYACIGGLEIHGFNATAKNNIITHFQDCINIDPNGTGSSNIEVENNTLVGFDGIVIWENEDTGATGVSDVRILNNNIQIEAKAGATTHIGGIRLSGSTFTNPIHNISIKGNTIEFTSIYADLDFNRAFSGGINLNNQTANLTEFVIKDNYIINSVSCGINIGSTAGTASTSHSNILITGNIIKNSGYLQAETPNYTSAIRMSRLNLKNVKVKDNIIVDNISNSFMEYAFFSGGTVVSDCYLVDNIITTVNSTSDHVKQSGVSTWIVENTKQKAIFSPNGTKYYIKVANDGTLSTATS